MGAWIEMVKVYPGTMRIWVAPLVGAWIEIIINAYGKVITDVAPLVGAWIEMRLWVCPGRY